MPVQRFVMLRLAVAEELFDNCYAILNDYPIQGIEEGHDAMTVCFAEEDWNDQRQQQLMDELAQVSGDITLSSTETIEQKNWNAEWEQSLEPVYVDEVIAITPSWHAENVHHPVTIIVDPKMSFGTGYHPTTRMTARLLRQNISGRKQWIDAGTGTGVLAIAAAKLGAESVYAFDNDDWSVENAAENVLLNSVKDLIRVEKADVFTVELPMADGMVANMYRNVLIPVFPKLFEALRSPNAPLIISGILRYDEDEVMAAAKAAGFKHIKTESEDEWIALLLERP